MLAGDGREGQDLRLRPCPARPRAGSRRAVRLRCDHVNGTDFRGVLMRPLLRGRFGILPRAVVARAWCLLVAVTVLFGAVHAGARYFYCEAMGLSTTDPCAQVARERRGSPLVSFERKPFDCCEVIRMPSIPEGARSVEPTVPAAAVVAIVAPPVGVMQPRLRGFHIAPEGERWRGPPRPASERCAQLMVFLT